MPPTTNKHLQADRRMDRGAQGGKQHLDLVQPGWQLRAKVSLR
jgi:hypothetical protein